MFDADTLRSAPPTVYADPYQPHDPFENSPNTTTASTFPLYSGSMNSSSTSTTGATVGLGLRDPRLEDTELGASSRLGHGHGHLERLFGGTDSSHGSRRYPKGDSLDDKEESVSLWHRPSVDSVESLVSLPSIPSQGSTIRLVSPPPKGNH
jgi:magnesium transporter